MPIVDYTAEGNHTWTVPFAVISATFTVIGGGGSGFKDCDGDNSGGGGGGGGFARSTRSVTEGSSYSVRVGGGGNAPGCDNANSGDQSYVTGSGVNVFASGGQGGTDDKGGGSGGGSGGDVDRNGQGGEDDDSGGKGGGAGNATGNSDRCGGTRAGGRGTDLDGSAGSCNGDKTGGLYGGGGGGNSGGDAAGAGRKGGVRISYEYAAPTISFFTVTNQLSCCNGIPSDSITLNWSTNYTTSVSINQGVGAVSAVGPKTINSGLQSTVGSNSPAQRTYTLTATGPGGTVYAYATTSVYNDNTPYTVTIPSTATYISGGGGTVSTSQVNPNATIELDLGEIGGVDMATKISGTNGLQARVSAGSSSLGVPSTGSSSFASTNYFYAGNRVRISVTSADFNTSPDGLTNSKSFTLYVGTQTYNFNITTRAPDINETFAISDNTGFYPYPKINISNPTPSQYMETSEVSVNDIELSNPYGVRAKSNQGDTQLRVKKAGSGSWETNSNTDASGWRYLQQGPGP